MTYRRKLLAGFGVAASVLMLSSVAYACTTFVGRMNVSNASGSDFYVGSRSGMNWCAADKGNPPPWNLTASSTGTNTVTVSMENATLCRTNPGPRGHNRAASGSYDVGLRSGLMPPGGGPAAVHNCHSGDATNTILGTFTVTTGGVGAAQSYNYTHGVGWHSICVYHFTLADANAVNINSI